MAEPDDLLKNLPEDGRVALALLAREVQYLSKTVGQYGDHVNKFLELVDRKVDLKIYLDDKNHIHDTLRKHDGRIQKVESEQSTERITDKAKADEREKILGMTKGTWMMIVQVIQILVLLGYIGAKSSGGG